LRPSNCLFVCLLRRGGRLKSFDLRALALLSPAHAGVFRT
jgi:hypothetical protein